MGCYLCPDCARGLRWFRLEPPGFEGQRDYTTATRHALVSLVKDHKLSFIGAAAIGRQLFHLPNLAGFHINRRLPITRVRILAHDRVHGPRRSRGTRR